MVKIPYIKIPSVRVGSIGPTSNIGAGATPAPPTPITYLTQWKIVGNSTVHTDEYLTQWKVEGNSVVDNNAILSCGDLGQDGKYHVKISNGVTIYDIPLTEPLRKVNNVADSIEFVNGVATLTRNIGSRIMGDYNCYRSLISSTQKYRYRSNVVYDSIKTPADNTKYANVLCPIYNTRSTNSIYGGLQNGISIDANSGSMYIYDENYAGENDLEAFKAHIKDVEVIYELDTPTTEVIQVSPFPVSPTDTYTSANDTPYSAFEYKKNVEIWSCGEYSEVDGKYHILVQPLGGSIADIALDEPLRKVNNVADSIEFADGVCTLTRAFSSADLGDIKWQAYGTNTSSVYRMHSTTLTDVKPGVNNVVSNILCALYNAINANQCYTCNEGVCVYGQSGAISIYDADYNQSNSAAAFKLAMDGVELIYELATPTTETIQVPQIQKADSYSCVISQGGKAVEWSSFETND